MGGLARSCSPQNPPSSQYHYRAWRRLRFSWRHLSRRQGRTIALPSSGEGVDAIALLDTEATAPENELQWAGLLTAVS